MDSSPANQRYTGICYFAANADVVCRFGEYDLHDLVELDHQTVGVMIQADAETCQILTNRNAVSCFSFAAIHIIQLPYGVVSAVSAFFVHGATLA